MSRDILVPILQAVLLLANIAAVVILGIRNVIDPPAILGILGAIVGSVGTLAAVGMANRQNGQPPNPRA